MRSSDACIDGPLVNVTNLDREPESVRYSGMPAGNQNEAQSPLAQAALARTSISSAAWRRGLSRHGGEHPRGA
jgi:hypothetical protein